MLHLCQMSHQKLPLDLLHNLRLYPKLLHHFVGFGAHVLYVHSAPHCPHSLHFWQILGYASGLLSSCFLFNFRFFGFMVNRFFAYLFSCMVSFVMISGSTFFTSADRMFFMTTPWQGLIKLLLKTLKAGIAYIILIFLYNPLSTITMVTPITIQDSYLNILSSPGGNNHPIITQEHTNMCIGTAPGIKKQQIPGFYIIQTNTLTNFRHFRCSSWQINSKRCLIQITDKTTAIHPSFWSITAPPVWNTNQTNRLKQHITNSITRFSRNRYRSVIVPTTIILFIC